MLTETLDKLMEQKKINKRTLAIESGIPYTTIDGLYKKGSENTKLSTLMKLANYFNVTLDYLVYRDDSRENPGRKAFTNEAVFAGLFSELTEDQQKFVIYGMEGILSVHKTED